MDADAHEQFGQLALGKALPKFIHRLLHLYSAADSTGSMVGLRDGHTESRHDGIADELADSASVAVNDFRHDFKVLVEQFSHFFRWSLFRDGREAFQVGEKHRRFHASWTGQFLFGSDDNRF